MTFIDLFQVRIYHQQENILHELIRYCCKEFADDANTVELTNHSLWIFINLTLADGCVEYLLQNKYFLSHLYDLMKSKYELIVHRVFELVFNITVEQIACDTIIFDPGFEEAFLHRIRRQNPEKIMNAAASIIKNFCAFGSLAGKNNNNNNFTSTYFQKIILFVFYCIRTDSINGLIQILPEEICGKFLKDYRALCLKLFSNPMQSINFINYLTSNELNEVLDLLLEYPLIEELLQVRNSSIQVKIYSTFSNLATYEPCHNKLRILFDNIYDQYRNSNLKMKMELGYFVSTYLQHCDPTIYGDLINNGVVDLLVSYFQDIYDPKAIEQALYALQNLFLNENAKLLFERLGGFHCLEKLKQNNHIIELVQRIN